MGNYNSLMEVMSGLNMAPVQRLRQLWDELPASHTKIFEDIDQLMSPIDGNKAYYEEMRKRPLPVFPYLGLFKKDICFINERTQNGNVDLGTVQLFGKKVAEFKRYQASKFGVPVPTDRTTMFMKGMKYIENEDALYELSDRSKKLRELMKQRTEAQEEEKSLQRLSKFL
jgi:hypothetical protein